MAGKEPGVFDLGPAVRRFLVANFYLVADVCEQDCSSMELSCIVDCEGDLGKFINQNSV